MTVPPHSDSNVSQGKLLHKPCRSGQTGMRPFGSLGPKIDVTTYGEQLDQKISDVKTVLAKAIPETVLDNVSVFPSPPTGHRHRAGPLVVLPGSSSEGSNLELAMWDPVAKAHSIVYMSEVPIYSSAISAAMEALRKLPIQIDAELMSNEQDKHGTDASHGPGPEPWGFVIGQGLRSVQFHSTLSGDLLVCLVYHDARLRCLRHGERLLEESGDDEHRWAAAAQRFREALQEAISESGVHGRVDVVGRWKRRRLVVERDYVIERFPLADGHVWEYQQPEGQFSNPNAPCEVHCLNWLCNEAADVRRSCGPEPLRLLELHCGGGNNTVALAPYFDEIVAVEINRVLASAAEANLQANGIQNVRLVRAPSAMAEESAAYISRSSSSAAQAVLVDPPRSGLDDETREIAARFANILYISCNPDALARDLNILQCSHRTVSFAVFDMFPYTTHAECAVRLVKTG
mmetsp:Transcript_123828/g.361550  ORF Transcript_123828/g.361550 Transcript_123828/m.361550 type:complete len:460 (+) Transcript_123828:62-1441(+)